MTSPPPRICRLLILLTLLTLISACSSTRLSYRFADRGAVWWVEDYVTLSGEQKSALRQDLQVLRDWHCQHELPRYSEWLSGLRQELERGELPPERIEHHRQKVAEFILPLSSRIAPAASGLLQTLTDDQVRELVTSMAENDEELRQEYLKDDTPESAAKRVRERAEKWLGQLNDDQREIVDRWSAGRQQQARIWLDGRKQWQLALAELLTDREAPDFDERLQDLVVNGDRYRGDAYQAMMARSTEDLIALTHELLVAADERHWKHLQKQTGGLQSDFAALSCAPASAAASAGRAAR